MGYLMGWHFHGFAFRLKMRLYYIRKISAIGGVWKCQSQTQFFSIQNIIQYSNIIQNLSYKHHIVQQFQIKYHSEFKL